MAYLGTYQIDQLLTFYANTHTAETGAVTDADSAPTYRVYINETGTPILTGTMALLDDANTVGFYSEQITLSAANGLVADACYAIRKRGVVATIAGAEIDTFQIKAAPATAAAVAALDDVTAAEVWAYASRTLTQGAAAVTAAVTGSDISVYRGTTWSIALTNIGALTNYVIADGKVYFTVKRNLADPDTDAILQVYNHLTTGLIRFNGAAPVSVANGVVTLDDVPTGDITVTVNEAETLSAPLGKYHYDIKGVDNDGSVVMLSAGGTFTITGDVTRATT